MTETQPPMLVDQFQRQINYLRLSVTDRCDLRCFYCLPEGFKDFQTPESWLTFPEILQLVRVLVNMGISRVRLTGGEPLTRRGIENLASMLYTIPGLQDLSLSTNATRLTKLAQPLYDAGVRRLNVSLDTLNANLFQSITGGKLNKVLEGLEVARSVGFSMIKINMVAMRGVNDDQIYEMIEYCAAKGFILRLIETMPMGKTGLEAQNNFLDLSLVKNEIAHRYTLLPEAIDGGGPARNYRIAENDLNIGFITPISQHFCSTCNRVRLTAEGVMHMCLGQEHSYDFRELLRQGIDDETLKSHILEAITLKPEKHEFIEHPGQIVRFMSQTGG